MGWKSITGIIVAAFVAGAVLGNFGTAGAGTVKNGVRVGIASLTGNPSAACDGDCGTCDDTECATKAPAATKTSECAPGQCNPAAAPGAAPTAPSSGCPGGSAAGTSECAPMSAPAGAASGACEGTCP